MGLLDNVKDAVGDALKPGARIDPSSFNDPVAEQTSWGPEKTGGTSVGSHCLKALSNQRVAFKARLLGLAFPGIFMGVGLLIIVLSVKTGLEKDESAAIIVGSLMGLVFLLVGFFVAFSWTTPRVFDKRLGLYWRGRKEPLPGMQGGNTKKLCKLEDIHAVQLIRERCTSTSSSGSGHRKRYYSYELNLVLHDASRINVVDHGKHNLIRRDAAELATFLDVPLWDAS